MSANGNIPFLKMNGLGNDFIIVDGRKTPRAFSRRTGAGLV
jgi:diaminopimelate epimerase